jgi:subtilisin family serine protease
MMFEYSKYKLSWTLAALGTLSYFASAADSNNIENTFQIYGLKRSKHPRHQYNYNIYALDSRDQSDAVPRSGAYEIGADTPDTSKLVFYILDSGVNHVASEFGNRLLPGLSFISGENDTIDRYYHGTHVASSVAGNKYGYATNASIVPMKILGRNGKGAFTGIFKALNATLDYHLARKHKGYQDLPIINLSIGAGFVYNAFGKAMQVLVDAGFLIFVAADNRDTDACSTLAGSFQGMKNVVIVGNMEPYGARQAYSDYGPCVTYWEDGVKITAVVNAGKHGKPITATMTGTSMATPRAAGICGLYWAKNPKFTATQVLKAIDQNVITINQPPFAMVVNDLLPKRVATLPRTPLAALNLHVATNRFYAPEQFKFAPLTVGMQVEAVFNVRRLTGKAAQPSGWLEIGFMSQDIQIPWPQFASMQDRNLDLTYMSYQAANIRANGDYWFRLRRLTDIDYSFEVGTGRVGGVNGAMYALHWQGGSQQDLLACFGVIGLGVEVMLSNLSVAVNAIQAGHRLRL